MRTIAILTGIIMIIFNSCLMQHRRNFIKEYEFEDFSQFSGVDMAIRGKNQQGNIIIYGYAPHLINDSLNAGYFILTLNKENNQIIDTELTVEGEYNNADTSSLHSLAKIFLNYKIPRINVEKNGNVRIYLMDTETLALIRFTDLTLRTKNLKDWVSVKGNWFRPKRF